MFLQIQFQSGVPRNAIWNGLRGSEQVDAMDVWILVSLQMWARERFRDVVRINLSPLCVTRCSLHFNNISKFWRWFRFTSWWPSWWLWHSAMRMKIRRRCLKWRTFTAIARRQIFRRLSSHHPPATKPSSLTLPTMLTVSFKEILLELKNYRPISDVHAPEPTDVFRAKTRSHFCLGRANNFQNS